MTNGETTSDERQRGALWNWAALVGAVGAALAAIIGPLSDLSEARLKDIEVELRKTEIELEKTKARQEYVLAAFESGYDHQEQIALLEFLKNEYPDDVTGRWVEIQAIRLKAIIQDESVEEVKQLRAEEEKIRAEVINRLGASEEEIDAEVFEEQLNEEEALTIQRGVTTVISAQRQLLAADALTKSGADAAEVPVTCDRTNVRAVVYKPFAADRLLTSYDSEERVGIVNACLEVRPPSSTEWSAQWLGPGDKLAKRIRCSCPDGAR